MSNGYRHNHYVPVWYQKRFLLPGQSELLYRDLQPGGFYDGRRQYHANSGLHRRGPKKCFAEFDLYTTRLDDQPSTRIEQTFFGQVDSAGREAVQAFAEFVTSAVTPKDFSNFLEFLGIQKLRTPKGLDWLRLQSPSDDSDALLNRMQEIRAMYHAIWSESIWQIADASASDTRFIITDHPVTVYNRKCGPRSDWCRDPKDPDVRLVASHTLYPLSLEKILIITNLSWVRNPYQDELHVRPNPNLNRPGVFQLLDVQTGRHLSDLEVQQINFILKSRARRYIAAARKEWLYPEVAISKSDWPSFGNGYLLMPDPRPIDLGGTVTMGFTNGGIASFDEYGRQPGQGGFESTDVEAERAPFYRFKGEFANLFGPARRGLTWHDRQSGLTQDSDELHDHFLSLESHYGRRHGKRRKRRRGQRGGGVQ